MQISTFARYGLRALIRLVKITKTDKKVASIKEIAKIEHISAKYLESIFSVLKKTGYLTSVKGKYGGYHLTKPANEITVYEIINTLDGNISPVNCVDNFNKCADPPPVCTVWYLWKELDEVIKNTLNNKTLEDLADNVNNKILL